MISWPENFLPRPKPKKRKMSIERMSERIEDREGNRIGKGIG